MADINELPTPITREELYLYYIALMGGGGGGTNNYDLLLNLPQINNNILKGNKTFEELGLEWIKPDTITKKFDETKTYSENDFVVYNLELYKCTNRHLGAWSDADFEKVTVIDSISSGGDIIDVPTAEEIAASIMEIWGGD